MPDAVIRADAIQTAPAGYKVPGAQEILVKSVRAVVDGSGAGSAFDAVLQLIDPAGNVCWQAPTSTSIAAGGSADVSWFPRVGAGGGSSSTATPAASMMAFNATPHTFVGNVGFSMTWTHFRTTDPSVFGTNPFGSTTIPPNNASGDVNIMLLVPGAYVAELTINWLTGTANFYGEIQTLTSDYEDNGSPTAIGDLASTSAPMSGNGDYMSQSIKLITVTASSTFGVIYALADGQTAGNYTVNSWTMVVHYLGSGIGTNHSVY